MAVGNGSGGVFQRVSNSAFSRIAERLTNGITKQSGFKLEAVADEIARAAAEITDAEVAYVRVPGMAFGEKVLNRLSEIQWSPELASLPGDQRDCIAGVVPESKHCDDCNWPRSEVSGGKREANLNTIAFDRGRLDSGEKFYTLLERNHFLWLKSEAFVPLSARENALPKGLLVLGHSDPEHFDFRRIRRLRQSQGFLNAFYQVADLLEDRLNTDTLLRNIAGVLPDIAKAPTLEAFQRAIVSLLTCEKGFGFNRALMFWMPQNKLPAECRMAVGGKGDEWIDKVKIVKEHYANKGLSEYVRDALEFPIPGTGPVPLPDPLYEDVCQARPLQITDEDVGTIPDAVARRLKSPYPAIPLSSQDPWIKKIQESRPDVFFSRHDEYWLYLLEPFGADGRQPPLGFVIVDLAYRMQPHSPGREFPNLGAAAVVLNLLASIRHAKQNAESYLSKLTGIYAFRHETPQLTMAIEGISETLNAFVTKNDSLGAIPAELTSWIEKAAKAASALMDARDVMESAYRTLHDHVQNVQESIERWCARWERQYPEIEFAIQSHYAGAVRIRRESLEQILEILVNNVDAHSVPYVGIKSLITIQIGLASLDVSRADKEDRVLIKVTDNGVAIPQVVAPFVFSDGISTSPEPSHGSGLSNARYLAKAYGGSVELLDNANGRVTFGVLLKKLSEQNPTPDGLTMSEDDFNASLPTVAGT